VGAILFRAIAPLAEPASPDLSDVPVVILSGLNDPIVPRLSAETLAAALAAAGARVERDDLPAGHGLTQADARKTAHPFRSKA
jgi:phospholipase/carboxylesterase